MSRLAMVTSEQSVSVSSRASARAKTSALAVAEDAPERRTRLPGRLPGEQAGHPRRIAARPARAVRPSPIVVRSLRGRRALRDVDADITAHHDVPQLEP